jgi:hypothetical protein
MFARTAFQRLSTSFSGFRTQFLANVAPDVGDINAVAVFAEDAMHASKNKRQKTTQAAVGVSVSAASAAKTVKAGIAGSLDSLRVKKADALAQWFTFA